MPKILVADEVSEKLTIVNIKLEMLGYFVEVVSQRPKTEKETNQFLPDLILLDVALDGADGREICKKNKKDPLAFHIPEALFSGNHKIKNKHQEFKAKNFIPKPFDTGIVVEVNKNTLTNNS